MPFTFNYGLCVILSACLSCSLFVPTEAFRAQESRVILFSGDQVKARRSRLELDHHVWDLNIFVRLIRSGDLEDQVFLMLRYRLLTDSFDEFVQSASLSALHVIRDPAFEFEDAKSRGRASRTLDPCGRLASWEHRNSRKVD